MAANRPQTIIILTKACKWVGGHKTGRRITMISITMQRRIIILPSSFLCEQVRGVREYCSRADKNR